jgi:5-methylcytosine-specific restriction protein A
VKHRLKALRSPLQQLGSRIQPAAATERIRGSALLTIRDRILTRDQGICRCLECERTGEVRAARDVDHHHPLWAGGAEDDSNRRAISPACHSLKSACETAMRSRGAFDVATCTCGRHGS